MRLSSSKQASCCVCPRPPSLSGKEMLADADLLDAWIRTSTSLSPVLNLFLAPTFSPSNEAQTLARDAAAVVTDLPAMEATPSSPEMTLSSALPPRASSPKESAREAPNRWGRRRLPQHRHGVRD